MPLKQFWVPSFVYLSIAILSLIAGDHLDWEKVWLRLTLQSASWNPLLDLRIPRLIVLSCTGASLAVSGCVMQALFRNPLASPSVLGISAGASLSVIALYILGLQQFSTYTIPLAAIFGALLTLLLVQGFFHSQNFHRLILVGVAISLLLSASQDLLFYYLRYQWELLQTLTEWQNGNTDHLNWQHVLMQVPITLWGLWGCWSYRKEIDLFSLGEARAQALGVDVLSVRNHLFIYVSLLTGSSIAVLGILPFFGLILPNLLRLFSLCLAQTLIPWCILVGGTLLVSIDYLMRVINLTEMTLGNVTAITGSLYFLMMLLKQSRGHTYSTNY